MIFSSKIGENNLFFECLASSVKMFSREKEKEENTFDLNYCATVFWDPDGKNGTPMLGPRCNFWDTDAKIKTCVYGR